MKRIWKTQDKNRYTKLEGSTVAIRTLEQMERKYKFLPTDYERTFKIVQVMECKLPFFIDEEKNEYHIGDILKVF